MLLRTLMMCGTCCWSAYAFGTVALFEGFEDGDYVANPAWVIGGSDGENVVVSDPIRADNLVLSIHGTDSGHRGMSTSVDQAWQGFTFEMEFLAATSNFSCVMNVSSGSEYYLGMWLIGPGAGGTGTPAGTRWLIADNVDNTPEWFAADPGAPILPTAPVGEWWRLRMSHDPLDGLIHGALFRVSDNGLIASRTYAPSTAVPLSQISGAGFGMEETDWQYADNIRLIPEPSLAILLTAASLATSRRRM